jgi:hypothetical protein
MNGETKTGVRVQTTSKAKVLYAGFPPAPHTEEEEEEGLSQLPIDISTGSLLVIIYNTY